MKILIVSDAWRPQINGVVRTLETTADELRALGHTVQVVGPDLSCFWCFGLPSYPEIRIELFAHRRLANVLTDFAPDFIHIATEGPLGWAMRRLCLRQQRPFTTSYHTRFPEYLAARMPRGMRRFAYHFTYAVLRRFHAPAGAVMVATLSIENALRAKKFRHIARWSRGVNADLFRPYGEPVADYENLQRPILLYVGRVAVEKNLRAFLDLKTTGSLVVIGDGPDLEMLRRDYPTTHFLGAMNGENLARHYAAADLFVFPSTTDTFGLVLLEAAAAGLRIAAYPAPGPKDILDNAEGRTFSALNEGLQKATDQALALPQNPAIPRNFTRTYTWQACSEQFYTHLQAPSPKAKRKLLRWRRRIGDGI